MQRVHKFAAVFRGAGALSLRARPRCTAAAAAAAAAHPTPRTRLTAPPRRPPPRAENYNDAVSAFRKHIEAVVDSSVGEHRLREAADKTAAMRAACVAAGQAHAFNAHLRSLGGKYAGDPVKGAFWKILGERGVGPVGEGEVAGSPVTAAEAAAALEAMRAGKGG